MISVKDTIQGCLKNERKSQTQLYQYLYRELLNVPLRYVTSREEANDVFNQGMLKIFNSLSKVRHVKNFEGWAYTILLRTTIDYVRKGMNYNKKHLFVEDSHEIDQYNSVNNVLDQLEAEDLFTFIQKLPKTERTVFSLYEIDGYKHKEIGALLNISESHSKYFLSHAKKKLRNWINPNNHKLKES